MSIPNNNLGNNEVKGMVRIGKEGVDETATIGKKRVYRRVTFGKEEADIESKTVRMEQIKYLTSLKDGADRE
jgi:hypothetical protein